MPVWGHREHHVAYLEARIAELEEALREIVRTPATASNAGEPRKIASEALKRE